MGLLVYNLLLFLLFVPVILPYLLWRLAKGKEDRAHWGERWGSVPEEIARDPRKPRFWVHCVSVGELMAAVPVLRELRRRFPDALIVVSTITLSGREVALKQVPPADEVIYFPLDLPFVANRALSAVRPDVVILMEWEIWPNFLTAAKQRHGARIAVLNGRVSDRGLRRGQRGAFFTKPGLAAVDLLAMQSAEDYRRATLVGADVHRLEILGNTKFDESVTALTPDERAALRADLGIPPDAPVWVCGSTRPGEEEIIAAAYREVRETFPNLFLIVAPRHIERTEEVAAVFGEGDGEVRKRSEKAALTPVPSPTGEAGTIGRGEPVAQPTPASHTTGAEGIEENRVAGEARVVNSIGSPLPPAKPELLGEGTGVRAGASASILLLDTFGELARVYAVADAAFIGGSLLPFGGQSVFQPLAQGTPALFGPFMNNQRDIAALSKAQGVGFEVAADAQSLAAEVIRLLLLSPDDKAAIAEKARGLIERNQGVAARCVDVVARLLENR